MDLPLHSPRSLLRRDIDPNPDLDPDLDLVVKPTNEAAPLDLFLTLPRVDINFDPDLFLASQEDSPIPIQ